MEPGAFFSFWGLEPVLLGSSYFRVIWTLLVEVFGYEEIFFRTHNFVPEHVCRI